MSTKFVFIQKQPYCGRLSSMSCFKKKMRKLVKCVAWHCIDNVKDDTVHSFKKYIVDFVWKHHISWIKAVWHTIVMKVLHFTIFGPKTGWQDSLVENPKLNPNNHYSSGTVVFVTRWVYINCRCSLYCAKYPRKWKACSLFKGTHQAGTFMSLKCVVYYANYRSWHRSSKIQVVS